GHTRSVARFLVQIKTCVSNQARRIIEFGPTHPQAHRRNRRPGQTRMVRLKHKLSEPPPAPERGVKAATFHLLLDTAMALIQQNGHVPSLAEVAARSKVSRATTYRYFPSRSALVAAVVDSSLGPVRAFASREPDGRA